MPTIDDFTKKKLPCSNSEVSNDDFCVFIGDYMKTEKDLMHDEVVNSTPLFYSVIDPEGKDMTLEVPKKTISDKHTA
ncbi:hypothetical protein A0J61_03958 [Choanephora cucurbitarum]|uniref:Uncharacterized protein n=1 Tax=Choanephora cucurbitarum TaxID=101091 RepID=A0A1C7NGW7_9FUNG|nr:hypothetical protein A0J61_03958 [Choanephora cucurbitarum]